MGRETAIEWCDSTANPMIGCDGCELWLPEKGVKICYAGQLVERYGGSNAGFPTHFDEPEIYAHRFDQALRWPDLRGKARPGKPWLDGLPRVIFWCDLGDPFTAKLPDDWLDPYLDDLAASPHVHLWLTKRPNRAAAYSRRIGGFPANFAIGTSVTGPEYQGRLDQLMGVQAGLLFLSYEPCFGDLDLQPWAERLRWAIVGGASGRGAEVAPLDRIRRAVGQCRELGFVPFLKQLGTRCRMSRRDAVQAVAQGAGWDADSPGSELGVVRFRDSKGGDPAEWPEDLRVREMPFQPQPADGQANLFL